MSYDADPSGLRALIARRTIEEGVKTSAEKLRRLLPPDQQPIISPEHAAPGFEELTPDKLCGLPEPDARHAHFNVGVIGGGMTGLYTAMILEDLDIPYEVLEYSGECGGRVWTRYFSNPKIEGDYYDVGAMRFPDIPIMKRAFALFDKLGIKKDTSENPVQGHLIPYYLSGPNNPLYYNDILKIPSQMEPQESEFDPFGVSVSRGGLVPDSFVKKGYQRILKEIFDDWKERFAKDFEKTWRELMELDAKCVTVRAYMIDKLTKDPYKPEDIFYVTNWCETMDAATNHYDCAFASLLLRSLEFEYPVHPAGHSDPSPEGDPQKNVWWCVNGGASIITERILERIDRRKILYNHRVTAINANKLLPHIVITSETLNGTRKKEYSYVISTVTTAALQAMDLRGANLKYGHREAIRVLRYDNFVKVGIKFKYRWWADDKGITKGGLGKTNRPTRVIVYPSYALNTPPGQKGVLLACYNWAQDAARLGSYSDEDILSLVIADLAIMHMKEESDIRKAIEEYHVHDWGRDSRTGGGFGLFGPGQFSTLFFQIHRPAANCRLLFAGEITSIYSGWVVASLNSAFRAVHEMLLVQYIHSQTPAEKLYIRYLLFKLVENWGKNFDEPKNGAEYDTDPQGMAGWQVYLGMSEEDV